MGDNQISKSKAKRLKIQNDLKLQKQKKAIRTMWLILVPVVILAMVVYATLYLKSLKIDYGKYLNDDGTIKDIDINDYVTDNSKMMSFSKEELTPDNSIIDNDINNIIKQYGTLDTKSKDPIKMNDTVNIAYETSIDGSAVASVNAADGGADVLISYDQSTPKEYYDSFIGKKIGDTFTTKVKYPADFASPDVAGKKVTYNITILGRYEYPKFDDDFVKEHYSDKASTADEYREYLKNQYFESNLKSSIDESLSANCVVNRIPDNYVAKMEKILDNQYETYSEEYGITKYDIIGASSKADYQTKLHESATNYTKQLLMYQAIFENAGLTNSADIAHEYFINEKGYSEDDYTQAVKLYGTKYVTSLVIPDLVMDYLVDNVLITD